jgi:peptidoglycan/LPS O-acetylase OafA/YrhL
MTFPHYPKSREIYSHTGLRGIAAMSVVMAHIYIGQSSDWHLNEKIFRFFQWHNYAVDLFFILSGFILNWVYLSSGKDVNWWSYIRARVARITPLYYATTIIAIPITIYSYIKHGYEFIGEHNYTLVGLANLLMVSGVIGLPTLNKPAWSISVEFFCYLAIFPILVWFARRLTTKKYGLITSIFLVFILTQGLILSYSVDPINIFNYNWNSQFMLRGLLGFPIGFILCSIYRSPLIWKPTDSLINLILLGSLLVFILTRINFIPSHILLYIFPFVIYFSTFDQGILANILKLNLFEWLGERSYSIYLLHMPILTCFPAFSKWIFAHYLSKLHPTGNINCMILVSIILVTSELSYKYFELPARNYIRKIGENSNLA